MDSYIDPFADNDSLGIDGSFYKEQRFSPGPSSIAPIIPSPSSMLGLTPQLQGSDVVSSAQEWPLTSSSAGLMHQRSSMGSFLDLPEQQTSRAQTSNPQASLPAALAFGDAGFAPLRQQSPSAAWLGNSEPWAAQQQQQRYQQQSADVLRQHYREQHAQQQVPSSHGLSSQPWIQQTQQSQLQQPGSHCNIPTSGANVAGMVPISSAAASKPGFTPLSAVQKGLPATAAAAQQQQQPAEDPETEDDQDDSSLRPQQQPFARIKQQQHQGSTSDLTASGMPQQLQRSGSLLGSGQALDQIEQQQQGAAAALPPTGAKKKSSKNTGGSKKASASATAPAVATTPEQAFADLWKPPPQPKEARIPKEPGVDYEDILPQGLDATNTRPLPIPTDILQLPDLGSILNLDTWNSVLDDQDRAQLRALLPNGGNGFSEEAGFQGLGLEALLGGHVNFSFGNPTAKFWEDLQSGTTNPRLRRQQEMVIQLRQQLAAAQLRNYHNTQVSTLLQMQRLWATQLPADASTAERLALWKAAQSGQIGMPESPRTAAAAGDGQQVDDGDDMPAAVDQDLDEASEGVGAPPAPAAAGVTSSNAASWPGQDAAAAAAPLGKRSAAAGVAMAVAAAAAAAGVRPASAAAVAPPAAGQYMMPGAMLLPTLQQQQQAVAGAAAGRPAAAAKPAAATKAAGGNKGQGAKKAAAAAADPKAYPVIGASRQNMYVYEGPVNFSKNLTKRQAAAAAAAAAKQQDAMQSMDWQQQQQHMGYDDSAAAGAGGQGIDDMDMDFMD